MVPSGAMPIALDVTLVPTFQPLTPNALSRFGGLLSDEVDSTRTLVYEGASGSYVATSL